jgi:hypothetical protein
VTEYVDTVFRENARRAVTRDPLLSTREAKERWTEAANKRAAFYQRMGRRDGARTDAKQSTSRGGGNSGGGATRGRGGGAAGKGGAQFKGKSARFNGKQVCYLFNKPAGCARPLKGVGCDNGNGGEYAHVCNHEPSPGVYCLGAHARHTFTH